jgi:5-methylcytosine-specific restriction endonuclease McrA
MSRNVGPACRWAPPVIAPEFKVCRRCMTIKPVGRFARFSKNRDGLTSYCMQCQSQVNRAARERYMRRYRAKNGDAIRARERERYVPRPLRSKDCVACGVHFTPTLRNQQRYCQEECRNRHRWAQRDAIPYRVRRKILSRDGWHCYLCDRPIPQEHRWPHPLSGTIDHVIPFSISQHHREDNLRAAHWRCNYDKGDALPGTEVWVPAEAA